MYMNKTLARVVTGALLGGLAPIALATNGDQMIGITAIQHGMAGAVIAAPQDAATMLFNPAGIADLGFDEVRLDLGVGLLNPERKVNGVDSDSKYYLMPGGAFAYKINERTYFGVGMGGLSGMGVDFDDTSAASAGYQPVVTTKQFYKIAPGFAHRVNERLSFGAALNIDYQSLALYNASYQLPQNQVYGYGFSLGAIYKVSDVVQIGGLYISEQHMDKFEWNTATSATTSGGKIKFRMNGPEQFGVGIAFRPQAGLLIEADIKRINFSEVLNAIDVDRPDGYTGGVPAQLTFGWSDQTVFALGIQKELSTETTVRAGYNYGKSPIGPEDVNSNVGSLAVVEHHLSLGLTRKIGKRASGSFSFVRALHNDVTSNTGAANKIELEQNILNLQFGYSN